MTIVVTSRELSFPLVLRLVQICDVIVAARDCVAMPTEEATTPQRIAPAVNPTIHLTCGESKYAPPHEHPVSRFEFERIDIAMTSLLANPTGTGTANSQYSCLSNSRFQTG